MSGSCPKCGYCQHCGRSGGMGLDQWFAGRPNGYPFHAGGLAPYQGDNWGWSVPNSAPGTVQTSGYMRLVDQNTGGDV
jgi:hypothetical protein